MGVCRGKISEGIDFSDNDARCVIIIGVPFSDPTAAKISIKRHILKKRRQTQPNLIDPETLQEQEAMKTINQALGRVIRHIDDFGSVILIDSRLN